MQYIQVSPRHTWIQLQHVTDSLKSPGTAHDSIIIQQDERSLSFHLAIFGTDP